MIPRLHLDSLASFYGKRVELSQRPREPAPIRLACVQVLRPLVPSCLLDPTNLKQPRRLPEPFVRYLPRKVLLPIPLCRFMSWLSASADPPVYLWIRRNPVGFAWTRRDATRLEFAGQEATSRELGGELSRAGWILWLRFWESQMGSSEVSRSTPDALASSSCPTRLRGPGLIRPRPPCDVLEYLLQQLHRKAQRSGQWSLPGNW